MDLLGAYGSESDGEDASPAQAPAAATKRSGLFSALPPPKAGAFACQKHSLHVAAGADSRWPCHPLCRTTARLQHSRRNRRRQQASGWLPSQSP